MVHGVDDDMIAYGERIGLAQALPQERVRRRFFSRGLSLPIGMIKKE
ncbi:MAG TPA: hypothetical protein VLN59_16050 [Burkholderiales bacterium]|nr:hypothetical protein [Burkholderiales bacterium]